MIDPNMALDAYDEVMAEQKQQQQVPCTEDVLGNWGPLPQEALVLGVADDSLPVMLNMDDPVPGPLLITGDPGSGKTKMLQFVAKAAILKHPDINIAVITRYPDEWAYFSGWKDVLEVFPIYDTHTDDTILHLASWAHGKKDNKQTVLLLIDDLETVSQMNFDAKQNLRWLLLRGPVRHVWPIVTLSSTSNDLTVAPWLEAFHTRVFGKIVEPDKQRVLGAGIDAKIETLEPGRAFTIWERPRWLRFWIPNL